MKKYYFLVLVLAVLIAILAGAFYFFNGNEKVETEKIEVVPLSQEKIEKVVSIIDESDFIDDMPSGGIISLRFYSFDDEQRVWHNGFLIGKKGIVDNGKPDIYVFMHAKYIDEIQDGLCEIMNKARASGDLTVDIAKNKGILLAKYSGMLKHKNCFGF